ncbi:MAG: phosphotransferase family protein [Candidatus Binatia bacterium]
MDLDELKTRLCDFCRAMYGDAAADVTEVHQMPGHAGFSWGFTVRSGGRGESWFLRLPPPNVQWRGTADVLRQAAVLKALDGTPVPHCPVRWSGDDLRWFGRPYFVVPKLEGDVLRTAPGEWGSSLPPEEVHRMVKRAVTALAALHRVDPARAPYLGSPIRLEDDVTRWDRFLDKVAEPEKLKLVPEVRRKLLDRLPSDAPVGIFHGDFQSSNLFYSFQGELLAVIDWELVGIGATLNDLGWFATFNDPPAWRHQGPIAPSPLMPSPEQLVDMYEEASGRTFRDVEWFRALAAYKFAIITGFNLGLHRRGKRHDPLWEVVAGSTSSLIERAHDLLG